ncbi:MAG: succinate dehydrogenase [Sporolactobacillus sp.]
MADRDYFRHRLHSLLGVIPIGLFLVIHLGANYQATRGVRAYNQAASFIEHLPFLLLLEILFIYLPIVFHAAYGIYLACTSSTNVGRFNLMRNWAFTLQRFSGLFLFIFILWHVWETRVAAALGTSLNFEMMHRILSQPAMFVFYAIGMLCTVFHFSNGLWAFCVHWGLLVSPKSQRIGSYVALILFLFLSCVGIRALVAFV